MTTAEEEVLQEQRGRELSMIFQSPRTSLNPIRTVGKQIGDVLLRHANIVHAEVKPRALALLERVKIADPERCYHAYPFELSGGMCQRILIAMALACAPALLIADEPTTGLDVVTQAIIMDLIKELALLQRMATMFITHDLGLAARYCERIVVMHAGHVVETTTAKALFTTPRHPYTAKLIAATPRATMQLADLAAIPGNLPDLRQALPPCRYSARCERHDPVCDTAPLPYAEAAPGHVVACWRPL
jgi:peptide/nickel transport system ATP-binding protein